MRSQQINLMIVTFLPKQVSELSQECEQLNKLVLEQKTTDESFSANETTCKELMCKAKILEEQIQNLGDERQQLW